MAAGLVHHERPKAFQKDALTGLEYMEKKRKTKAMDLIDRTGRRQEQHSPIPFEDFVELLSARPVFVLRDVFQVFYDMVKSHVGEGRDEYPGDPESVGFLDYDCNSLFIDGTDHPFFADRIFANRLMRLVDALKRGAQQNKIYVFDGPPGCGKSTFLNNLLKKFEEFANSEEGLRFETVWRLDRQVLGDSMGSETSPILRMLSQLLERDRASKERLPEREDVSYHPGGPRRFLEEPIMTPSEERIIEVPCPSHDHPILIIPKEYRREFLEELFGDHEFGHELFNEKEYGWVFSDKPCTICSSLFETLLDRLNSPLEVFKMAYVRPYRINRRLGEGISVYNPGDGHPKQQFLTNQMVQKRIDALFRDSNLVRYIFSRYARTNNGIYALMDVKSNNCERFKQLHNIVSEGVHKVEDLEESVYSLFMAVMNPEDRKEVKDIQSFSDRIEYVNISYIMDFKTEVEIYRSVFGQHIDKAFLPRVLDNFARVIVSSRLNVKSEGLLEWIDDPKKYRSYCDENLQLLKMELYTGHIPPWLAEEDRKSFSQKRRRKVLLAESETEGRKGFSGRDSIKIFNEFYSTYAKEDELINMSMLFSYFTKVRKDLGESIPGGFLDSLLHMYDYTVLQEVKESLYYYNEAQISRQIQNYLFALNFEVGTVEVCNFTGEKIDITEDFLERIERHILLGEVDKKRRLSFRKDVQKEYASKTLTQEIMLQGRPLTETDLYVSMHDRYVHNLKERVMDPFQENENFRRAINDYGKEDFKTYDKKIRDDVTYLIKNLCEKYGYVEKGAKEVCMYVIDNDLAKKYANP
jgi:hypothetical protein